MLKYFDERISLLVSVIDGSHYITVESSFKIFMNYDVVLMD